MADNNKRDYRIGYSRPPLNTRFKKGQSGNPKGRKPGSQSSFELLDRALSKQVTISTNGRRRKISRRAAACELLVKLALGGDLRAMKLLLEFDIKLRPAEEQPQGNGGLSIELLSQLRERYEAAVKREQEENARCERQFLTPEEREQPHRLQAKARPHDGIIRTEAPATPTTSKPMPLARIPLNRPDRPIG